MMENPLLSLKSVIDMYLSPRFNPWVIDTIFGILFGLGLFLLLHAFFHREPSTPASENRRNHRRHPVEPRWGSRKKSRDLEVYRACLHELHKARRLLLLLRSHLGRHLEKDGFPQTSGQDLPHAVHTAAPERAHRPCWQHMEDATLSKSASSSLAPAPDHPLPEASVWSPGPMPSSVSVRSLSSLSALQPPEPFLPLDCLSPLPRAHSPSTSSLPDSEAHPPTPTASSAPPLADSMLDFPPCASVALPLDTISQGSSPHTPWSAAPSCPAISGLGHPNCYISSLTWQQLAGEAQGLSPSTRFKARAEHLTHHPPEATIWAVPAHMQADTGTPSFQNCDIHKPLETPITKREQLKDLKERKEKERSGYLLNSLENTHQSPGDAEPQSPHPLWRMKDQPEQLLGPERPPHPETSGDPSQEKSSQLFCGLPFPHNKPLLAAGRHTPPAFSSGTLSEICNALPVEMQDRVTSHFTLAQFLPQPVTEAQLFTPAMPQIQPPPLAQIQTKTHVTPSLSIQPPSCSAPQMRTSQNKAPSFIPVAMEKLGCQLWKQQAEQGRSLHFLAQKPQEVFSQLTAELPPDDGASPTHDSVLSVPGNLVTPEHREEMEHHLPQRFTPLQRSAFASKGSQDTEKIGPRCPSRIPPSMGLASDVEHHVGRILRDVGSGSASCPLHAQGTRYKEAERNLLSPSTGGPDKKQPENTQRVHLDRKLAQIHASQIAVGFHVSRLAANHALDLLGGSNPQREARKPASSKGWEPCLNTSHKFSVSSPRSRQVPEAHIGKARGRHWKRLPLKVCERMEGYKVEKARGSPFVHSPITGSTSCASRALSKARLAAFFGKRPQLGLRENVTREEIGASPQPVAGERVKTEESGSTPERDLHTPAHVGEEIPRALGRTPPSDGRGPSESPMIVQEERLPPHNVTYPFVGRIWHSASVVAMKEDGLELSPTAEVARKEPSDETVAQTSRDSCGSVTILELSSESQSSGAEEVGEAVDALDASAWGVISGPSMLGSPRHSDADLRRAGSAGSSISPSLPTELADQDPEGPHLDGQLSEFKLRELGETDNQTQGGAATVLLEDCATDVTLLDCVTRMPRKECRTDVFLVADRLASQASLIGSHSMSTGDMSSSLVQHDITSSEGSNERGSLGMQDQYKSQGKTSVSTAEREDSRSLSPGQQDEGLTQLRPSPAIRTRTRQNKMPVESISAKPFQLVENRQASPEDLFKRKMKHLLRCDFPRKGKGLKHTLQEGQPSAATAQRWEPAQSSSVLKSRAAEAQALLQTVGHMVLQGQTRVHHDRSASEFSGCKGEHGAPADPPVCSHRVLSYNEQRQLMKDMACGHQATPRGPRILHKSSWATDRNCQGAFPPREPALPGLCQHGLRGAVPSGSPRHAPKQRPVRRGVSSAFS